MTHFDNDDCEEQKIISLSSAQRDSGPDTVSRLRRNSSNIQWAMKFLEDIWSQVMIRHSLKIFKHRDQIPTALLNNSDWSGGEVGPLLFVMLVKPLIQRPTAVGNVAKIPRTQYRWFWILAAHLWFNNPYFKRSRRDTIVITRSTPSYWSRNVSTVTVILKQQRFVQYTNKVA